MEELNKENVNKLIVCDENKPNENKLSFDRFVKHIFRYKYWILSFTILGFLLGFLGTNYFYNPRKETFSSSFKLNLPNDGNNIVIGNNKFDTFSFISNKIIDQTLTDLEYNEKDKQDILSNSNIKLFPSNLYKNDDKHEYIPFNFELKGNLKPFGNHQNVQNFVEKLYENNISNYSNKLIKSLDVEFVSNSYYKNLVKLYELVDILYKTSNSYGELYGSFYVIDEKHATIDDFITNFNLKYNFNNSIHIDLNTFKIENSYSSTLLNNLTDILLGNIDSSESIKDLTEEQVENFGFIEVNDQNKEFIKERLIIEINSIKKGINYLTNEIKSLDDQLSIIVPPSKPEVDTNNVYYELVRKKSEFINQLDVYNRKYLFVQSSYINASRNLQTKNESTVRYLKNKEKYSLLLNEAITVTNEYKEKFVKMTEKLLNSDNGMIFKFNTNIVDFFGGKNGIKVALLACGLTLLLSITLFTIIGQYRLRNKLKQKEFIPSISSEKDEELKTELEIKSKEINDKLDFEMFN